MRILLDTGGFLMPGLYDDVGIGLSIMLKAHKLNAGKVLRPWYLLGVYADRISKSLRGYGIILFNVALYIEWDI